MTAVELHNYKSIYGIEMKFALVSVIITCSKMNLSQSSSYVHRKERMSLLWIFIRL